MSARGGSMLTAYPLNGFLRITDPERARHFYEQVLGLTFDYENPYVSVFHSGDTTIIGQRVKEVVPIASTVLGWEVKDIEKVVAFLRDRVPAMRLDCRDSPRMFGRVRQSQIPGQTR